MKILVTGGAGFIGSQIVDAYLGEGHEVSILDNFSSGLDRNIQSALQQGARVCKGDITDKAFVHKTIQKEKPDIINHHAAQISVRKSVEDPVFDAEVNIHGLINLLEASKEIGLKRFVFASSGGAIYGEQTLFPADESHPQNPKSPYGLSKLCGEHYLQYYSQESSIPVVCFRYSNVYGPRQDPHGEAGVVAIFCQSMLANKEISIFDDGEQTRDFVFVKDIAAANCLALKVESHFEIFNVGCGKESSVNQLFSHLRSLAGYEQEPTYKPARAGEQKRSSISANKFMKDYSWKPSVNFEEGLRQTFDWFSKNKSS